MDIAPLLETGLNESQAKAYAALLEAESLTPPQLAATIGVARTNAYELMDQLLDMDLIAKHEQGSKLAYSAKSPVALKQLLLKQQISVREKSHKLDGILPELLSTYRLVKDQPGVLYLEGETGLTTLFDDIIRQNDELLIFPSARDRDNPEIAAAIDTQIERQIAAGVKVRTLYPTTNKLDVATVASLAKRQVSVRYINRPDLPAQVMIYGGNVAFSTFGQSMVTTIITNTEIAQTMRLMFEALWEGAETD